MDRRKISRSLRASAEGVKIKVKSNCGAPTLVLMEDQNPSIYEIDILSSFDFHKNKKKETDGVPIKMSVAKTETRVLEIKREESTKECKVLEIPLLESYYPTFQQEQSNVKSISFEKEKIDSKIQTDLNFGRGRQKENEEKVSKEKVDKENHSPAEDFKEFFKNIMTENFILKDDSDFKTMYKNLYKKLNKNQLHLHHHEHHHHYYLDNSTLLNENISSFPFKKTFSKSQKVKCADECKFGKDKKQTGKTKVIEKEQPTQTYYFKCPRESNLTFIKTSSDTILKPENNESSKANKTSKVKEKKSSGILESSPQKFSSSVESIINKKSDFITTHIYSDTELKKCDSEMLHGMAIPEFKKGSWKESKKDGNNDFNPGLNNLKNFNNFISPVVTENQKTAPQTSFVKYECTSSEGSNTPPNDRCFYDINNSGEKVEDQEKTYSLESEVDVDEYVEKETGRCDYEIWTTKLKAELGEIKKELKRIEEKHVHKRKSFASTFKSNKSLEGSDSSHNITVYSSKIFIVGANNLYLTQKNDREIQSVSKI